MTPTFTQSERPIVVLEDGTQIKPKLLVGSDGEKSLTRSQYKIGTSGHSYGQKGLVCTVSCLQPNEIAYQRFLKTGPLALLPLWGTYSSVVWSLPDELCEQLQSLPESKFIEAINSALHNTSDASFIGAVPQIVTGSSFQAPPLIDGVHTRRFSFPLAYSQAEKFAAERLALISDAAHRVHPLAG